MLPLRSPSVRDFVLLMRFGPSRPGSTGAGMSVREKSGDSHRFYGRTVVRLVASRRDSWLDYS